MCGPGHPGEMKRKGNIPPTSLRVICLVIRELTLFLLLHRSRLISTANQSTHTTTCTASAGLAPATLYTSTWRRCIPRFYQLSEDASSGLKVSQLDVKEAKILLPCCCHHAEEIMGQAFRELGWKRSDLVLSTKIFWGLSRKHIVEATPIEETVRAMNYVIDHGWAFYWGTSESSTDLISDNLRFSCFRLPPLLEKIR